MSTKFWKCAAATLPLLAAGIAGCFDRTAIVAPIDPTDAELTPARHQLYMEASAQVGCGITISNGTGSVRLAYVARTVLPREIFDQVRPRISKSGNTILRSFDFPLSSINRSEQREARCILPFDIAGKDVEGTLRNVLEHQPLTVSKTSALSSDLAQRNELLDEALYLPLTIQGFHFTGGKSEELTRSNRTGQPASLGWGGGWQDMATVIVTGTRIGGSTIFGFGQLEAAIHALYHLYPNISISWNGIIPDCQDETDLWFALDGVKKYLDDIAVTLANNTSPNMAVPSTQFCPDSLMNDGDSCADFYISTLFVGWTPGLGDGRLANPKANITESRLQVIPHFDQNKVDVLINGSSLLLPTLIAGQFILPTIVTANADSGYQLEKFDVDSIGSNVRTITIKASNAFCAQSHNWLDNHGLSGIGGLVNAACPSIDATITYSRTNGVWAPTIVSRDGYPTLDIWKKTGPHTMTSLSHVDQGSTLGLTGMVQHLRYVIQQHQEELDNDHECELQ